MKLSLKYTVSEIRLSEKGGFVEIVVDPIYTKILDGEGVRHVKYPIIIPYLDYVKMNPKVGNVISFDIRKIMNKRYKKRMVV